MSLPTHRRLLPAAMALLAAAELSVGAVGLASHGLGSRPGPATGVKPAGPGPEGPGLQAASASRGSGPVRSRRGGVYPTGGAATPGAALAPPPSGVQGGSGPAAASPTVTAPADSSDPTGSSSQAAATYAPAGAVDAGASDGPVACQTDLPLDRSPDTGYDFLCQSGGAPLTWPKSTLVFYEHGLSLVQSAAVDVAVGQWEAAARFGVVYTKDEGAADVVITAAPLDSGQAGYTEDGYTTVSYRCSDGCAYYHAAMTLSSTASLTSTDWISTTLHELGHVAGLNHVSEAGEVMYPYLTLSSPVVYATGDIQGLGILAAERGA
ncbi:MAG TPA: matrixin family metalloprotease [Acidimicrobiales bacterium]|nr:matrixin family metalloprotease [Acidimicrobiales bacterium]